jgi:HAMP domain-containing protein/HPt (histidine-containing phosphotransfer) domain-containing protein/two-component sensor histidine kinase
MWGDGATGSSRSRHVLNPRQTVRAKLVRTMLVTLALVTAAVIATVAVLHVITAKSTLALVETKIRESIIRKGQGLVTNHAQALRGLVADNAFSDVRRLVEGAVAEDPEIAYGLFLGAELQPWAYVSPTTPPGSKFARETWLELKLDNNILARPSSQSLKRQLFGKEVFEFSSPVVDDEGKPAGAIIYGAWTAPLETALNKARADSRRSFVIASIVLGLLTAGVIVLGWLLVRRAADRITRPIAELTRATAALAAGDRHLRVSIKSRDEIETLGDAFNQMVGELDESYARLEGLNRTLEERVVVRTRELADRNRDLRLVLDTVNEGLLTVSREGHLAQERSAMIDQWFGPYTGQIRFVEYIAKIDPVYAERFALGFEAMLEDVLTLELYIEQLPSRLRHNGRQYKCTYLPILEGEQVQGLLLVINDITQQLLLAKQDAEQRELLALFQGFTRDRLGLVSLFEEATELVGRIVAGKDDLKTHRRLIHTLKGNALLAQFNVIGELAHTAEDEVDETQKVAVTPTILALEARWARLAEALRGLQGDRGREVVEIRTEEIDQICNELSGVLASAKVLEKVSSWRNEPVEQAFRRLGDYGRALAQRLGRGDLDVEISGGGVRLDPVLWGPFWSEMVHLIRNAVDHGLESEAERVALGKTPRPHLRLRARLEGQGLVMEVEDDGRGIDWEAIRRAGRKRGLPVETEAELLAALLSDGVSARETVSTTSGRGVGMSALSSRVRALGGELGVVTGRNKGTSWRMTFPMSALKSEGGARGATPAITAVQV